MGNSAQKQELAAFLRKLAENQAQKEAPAHEQPARSRTVRQPSSARTVWYQEIAREQISRETWEERQRYAFPPVIAEDIVQSILYGQSKGVLDLANDTVAASLMDAQEIRKLIQLGRLDPSELPLLKYRIDKLVGLSHSDSPPGSREALSSLVYHYRANPQQLEEIRRAVLEEMRQDFESGAISAEEMERYRAELEQIIAQYT